MRILWHILTIALTMFCFLSLGSPAVAQERDSLVFRITFQSDSAQVNLDYSDNRSVIVAFGLKWIELNSDSTAVISGIRLVGNSSRDGWYDKNNRLAQNRAECTADFLSGCFAIDRDLFSTAVHPWLSDTAKLSAKPVLVKVAPEAEERSCHIIIDYSILPPVSVAVGPESAATDRKSGDKPVRSAWRIKTNLLYDVATVANLSIEYGFCGHWAVELLATFSPWDISSNFKIRTLLFQPEVRYYLKEGFSGHYFGLEGHVGWYNVAFPNNPTRFQDRDGNSPLWGAGLLYGYVLPFSKHWGMDFNIALGYAYLDYDCFYNVENGAKYTSDTHNWFGPTKLGVTIYYQF